MAVDPKKPESVTVPLPGAFADYSVREFLGVWFPTWPRRALDDLFASGRVRSENRPVALRRRVGELADLTVVVDPSAVPEIFHERAADPLDIPILFEDERIVVLEKPSGVSVVPDRTLASGESCLGFLLRRELEQRVSKDVGEFCRLRVVHRIDRWTSGVVIFAKTPEAERTLSGHFEERRIDKEYLALLTGDVLPARVQVDVPVAPARKGRYKADADACGARAAQTEFEVLERFGEFTLVVARPRTGRTHQIRVHALAIGYPLAVDPLYRVGVFRSGASPPLVERLTLHAARYRLPPDWPGVREFESPLPADLATALAALRAR